MTAYSLADTILITGILCGLGVIFAAAVALHRRPTSPRHLIWIGKIVVVSYVVLMESAMLWDVIPHAEIGRSFMGAGIVGLLALMVAGTVAGW